MRNYFILFCSTLLLLLSNDCEASVAAASTDSIPGQAQLIRQLSAEVCQDMATNQQRASFATMRPAQAQETFETLLLAAINKQVKSIQKLAQRSGIAGAYEKLAPNLSTLVAIHLVRTCPDATTLYNRFINAQTAEPTPAEQAFIRSWGDELCQRLTTLHQQGHLQGKTSAECMELFRQEFMAALTKYGPRIMQLYGAEGNSQQVVELLSERIITYTQEHCPQTLLLLRGTDVK